MFATTDDQPTSEGRAQNGEAALDAFLRAKGEQADALDSDIPDLITDLLLYAQQEGEDIDVILRRARLNFEAEQEDSAKADNASEVKEVLFATTMTDWRDHDGCGEDVPEEIRGGQYKIDISRSGYGGLYIDVESPAGVYSGLLLEGDMGFLKINTYGAADNLEGLDETDAIIHLDRDGTHVTNNYSEGIQHVRFQRDGALCEKWQSEFDEEDPGPSPR